MHFTSAPFSRLTHWALTLSLACAASAQAQTLVDTVTTASIQNTLNSIGTVNATSAAKQIQTGANQMNVTPSGAEASSTAQTQPGTGQTSTGTAAPTVTAPVAPPVASPPVAGPLVAGSAAVQIVPLSATQQLALAAAQANLKAGNYAKARTQLEALVAQNYNNPEPHFGLALALLGQKDDKGAIFELGQFQLLAPDRYEAPYNLGVIAARAGRYDDALKLYGDAATLAQGKATPAVQTQILSALAGEQTRKGDYAALTTTLQALNTLKPNDNDIQYRLAAAQTLTGAGTQALPGLYALLQRQPGRVEAITLLADIYVAQGLPDRALREIDSAMNRVARGAPRSALLLHKANILAQQGDSRSAIFSAQAAHVQNPNNVDAFVREAELRLARNDRAGALDTYQSAVKVAPGNAKVRTDLAALRLTMGQSEQAAIDAAQALKLLQAPKAQPDSATQARAQFVQGVALYRQGQYGPAKALLNASALSVSSADTTLWLGLANYALKDYAAATAALTQSVKLNPTVTARQNLASALLASGRYAEAEALLRGLVTENARNGDAWYLLGLAQRGQQHEEEARKSLKTAAGLGNTRAVEALK